MQHLNKTYEENKFIAAQYRGIQLDGDKIQVDLDQTMWTEVMEGQWALRPQKPMVGLLLRVAINILN